MATMDIFKGDAFSTVEMTQAVDKVPYKPNFLESLGIFEPDPIRTISFSVESRDNVLSLVQTSERGAPLAQGTNEKRKIRDFRTVRVAKGDRVSASELAGIRQFGTESELQQVQAEIMRRMVKVRDDIDLTHENMRLGALQGKVLDADGSTIYDWFSEWGISQSAEIDFDLDNASPASGAVKKLCNQVIRSMARNAKGAFTPTTKVMALCGDNFYDDLTAHPEIRATYLNQQQASQLRGDYANAFESFNYGGITWVNYRGTDDGSTVAVGTDKAKFFPVGARGVFSHVMSPGETFDWVNTLGKPFYSMMVLDKDRSMFADAEVYSYPMYICKRPEVLLRGKRT